MDQTRMNDSHTVPDSREVKHTMPRYLPVVFLLVFSAIIIAARFHTMDEPLERDIATYAVDAHEIVMGRTLYKDTFVHQPPAILITYAAAERLLGYGRGAVWFLIVAATIVTLIGVYVAGVSISGVSGGLWAAVIWTVICGSLSMEANQPNQESFINAFLIWAFVLFVRAEGLKIRIFKFLVIGALFALATLYKPIIVCSALFLSCCYLITSKPGAQRRAAIIHVLIIGIVGIAIWAAMFIYFAATDRLNGFVNSVFVYNAYYSGSVAKNLAVAVFPRLILKHLDIMKFTLLLPPLVIAGMVSGFPRRRGPWALLLAFLIASMIQVALPGKFFPHYYQLLLPLLAVGAGAAIPELARRAKRGMALLPRFAGAAVIVIILAHELPFYRLPSDEWSRMKYGPIFSESDKLAVEINRLLKPDETFYEWGDEPNLYFETGRRPPSNVTWVKTILYGPRAAELSKRVLSDLRRTRPELLVLVPGIQMFKQEGPVFEWLMARYVPMPGGNERGLFSLYVRHGGKLESRMLKNRSESLIFHKKRMKNQK